MLDFLQSKCLRPNLYTWVHATNINLSLNNTHGLNAFASVDIFQGSGWINNLEMETTQVILLHQNSQRTRPVLSSLLLNITFILWPCVLANIVLPYVSNFRMGSLVAITSMSSNFLWTICQTCKRKINFKADG